jgi:hypothetical protein
MMYRSIFLLIGIVLGACANSSSLREGSAAIAPSAVPAALATELSITGLSKLITIVPDLPWELGQANSLTVETAGLDQDLLLAVELTPLSDTTRVAPTSLPSDSSETSYTPVQGLLALCRVGAATQHTSFVFPSQLFAAMLNGEKIQGWELRVVLTEHIDAYPLSSSLVLGEIYRISPHEVAEQPTWIEAEAEQVAPISSPEDLRLIIPHSAAGMFLYYPNASVREMVLLSVNQDLELIERG